MDQKKDLIIFGTGGFAIEFSSICKEYLNILGFVGKQPKKKLNYKYLGDDKFISRISSNTMCIVAVGNTNIRKKIYDKILNKNKLIGSFVHPRSYVSFDVKIPKGVIIYPGSTIHSRVKLGFGTLINSNVSIGHESTVSKFVNLNPGVTMGGNCKISENVTLGIGCTVLENIKIGKNIFIGANALVNKNLNTQGTYIGVPAKIIK